MKYSGYTARKLVEAAEAFEKELSAYSHGDDFWELKRAVGKFAGQMRENNEGDKPDGGRRIEDYPN